MRVQMYESDVASSARRRGRFRRQVYGDKRGCCEAAVKAKHYECVSSRGRCLSGGGVAANSGRVVVQKKKGEWRCSDE